MGVNDKNINELSALTTLATADELVVFDADEAVNTPTKKITVSNLVTDLEGKISHDNLVDYAAGQHRVINDSGTSATELWSASKINTELGGKSDTGHSHTESDISDLDHNDTDAVHDNVSGEIAAITRKNTPVDADLLLIEDSASSNAKKYIQAGDLPYPVTSVFSRTGAITAQNNDYTWAQIDKTTSDIADITTKSHTSLSDIGTNTHAQIDTHISSDGSDHSYIDQDVTSGSSPTFTGTNITGVDAATVDGINADFEAGDDGKVVLYEHTGTKIEASSISVADLPTASSNITDDAIVRGDGGSKGIQSSLVTIDDSGSINIPSGQTYKINSTQIASSDLSNDSNLVKADGTQALSADWDVGAYDLQAAQMIAENFVYSTVQGLTDGANIGWNLATSAAASVTTAGDRTFDAATNQFVGLAMLKITCDGTDRTHGFNANFLMGGGNRNIDFLANTVNLLLFWCDGTNLHLIGITQGLA